MSGGSLADCLCTPVEPENVLKIFYQAVKAVAHLHSQSTPIIHRDIKVNKNSFPMRICRQVKPPYCLMSQPFE